MEDANASLKKKVKTMKGNVHARFAQLAQDPTSGFHAGLPGEEVLTDVTEKKNVREMKNVREKKKSLVASRNPCCK